MALCRRITCTLSQYVKQLSGRVRTMYNNAKTAKVSNSQQISGNKQGVVLQQLLSHPTSMQKETLKTETTHIHCDARKAISVEGSTYRKFIEQARQEPEIKTAMLGNSEESLLKSNTQLRKHSISTVAIPGSSSPCSCNYVPNTSHSSQGGVLQRLLDRAGCMPKESFKTKWELIHGDARKDITIIPSTARNKCVEQERRKPKMILSILGNRAESRSKCTTQLGRNHISTSTFQSNISSCPSAKLPSSFTGKVRPCTFDIVVIGGGIVGTAAVRELSKRYPTFKLALVEKESELALHQSLNNSGVIHAGIYYPPNSKYAELCVRGCELMYKYCDEKDIPYKRCGKLIVAVHAWECEELINLYRNALTNKVVGIRMVGKDDIQKIEPHCVGIRAIHSPNTGVVAYKTVTEALGQDFLESGGQIFLDFKVEGFGRTMIGCECYRKTYPLCIHGGGRYLHTRYAVVCAGLHADRLALSIGGKREPMILPMRGNFLQLKPEYTHLVQGNIYPVPEKNNPFPGVHATHRIDGTVRCGPTAMMSLHREGYQWNKISARDVAEMITYGGFYKSPLQFGKSAWIELAGAFSTRFQIKMLKKYIPVMKLHYVHHAPSGVAALALTSGGVLEKDIKFEVVNQKGLDEVVRRVLHVRSAPSPAATSSLAIAEAIADKVHSLFFVKNLPPPRRPHYNMSACDIDTSKK